MNIIIGYIVTYFYIFLVLGFASIIKFYFKTDEEIPRKLIHILVSFSFIIMISFFELSYHIIIPPITFVIMNYLSYKMNIVKAMERKNNESLGTVYYPISILILSIVTLFKHDFLPAYAIGLFTMAFGDGLASIVGKNIKSKTFKFNQKTIYGFITVFVSTLFISLIISNIYNLSFNIIKLIMIALVASFTEFFSKKGLDNLFLPIITATLSYLFIIF